MEEMKRVTVGTVFLVVPKWWAPHTWLHLGHRSYIDQTGRVSGLWPKEIASRLP